MLSKYIVNASQYMLKAACIINALRIDRRAGPIARTYVMRVKMSNFTILRVPLSPFHETAYSVLGYFC